VAKNGHICTTYDLMSPVVDVIASGNFSRQHVQGFWTFGSAWFQLHYTFH